MSLRDTLLGTREEDHTARNVGMGAAAGVPLLAGAFARNTRLPKNVSQRSFKDIQSELRAGDVVLSGNPAIDRIKSLISLGTGEPDYTHSELVLDPSHPRGVSAVSAAPGKGIIGGFSPSINEDRRVRILRRKAPTQEHLQKRFADGFEQYSAAVAKNPDLDISDFYNQASGIIQKEQKEQLYPYLERLNEQHTPYSNRKALLSGLEETLIPEAVLRKLRPDRTYSAGARANAVTCDGGICSSVAGGAFPELESQGRRIKSLTPSQLGSATDVFDVVGEYVPSDERRLEQLTHALTEKGSRNPRMLAKATLLKEQLGNKVLRQGKWLTRGALGAAGAGTIYGGSRLLSGDHDLSGGELAAGAGAMGLGALPFAAKPIADFARKDYFNVVRKNYDKQHAALTAQGMSPAAAEQEIGDQARKLVSDVATEKGLTPRLNLDESQFPSSRTHPLYRSEGAELINKYSPDKGIQQTIRSPAVPSYLMHELGHAEDYARHGDDSLRAKMKRPIDTLGGAFRTLREETAANTNALKSLFKHRGAKGALRGARELAPGYATYLTDILRRGKAPAAVAGLGGAGLLGYNLLRDKEPPSVWQQIADRLT